MAGDLPPRPDPQTGEPFPPHAPGFVEGKGQTPAPEQHKLEPPTPDDGPALAWYRSSPRSNIVGFILVMLAIMLVFSIMTAAQGDAFGAWVAYWPMWLIVVVGSALIANPFRVLEQSAGVDWFSERSRRLFFWWLPPKRRNMYVYEITEIKSEAGGQTGIHLDIIDLRGNELYLHRDELERNQRIWDLFYNGIVHSAANGAAIDHLAQQVLSLPNEAKEAKILNWKNGNPMPNWPSHIPFPDPEADPLDESGGNSDSTKSN